ncbi:MAG: hypothetical protein K2N73_02755 [Lachnospiraceae bacterium]|nr:hypothetical protein [Lachnospiraceae bacterium]
MEQVIGEREAEQEIRGRIETEFDVTVLRDASVQITKNLWSDIFPEISSQLLEDYCGRRTDKNAVFAVTGDEIQSMLYLTSYAAALRRNPSALRTKRLPCMTDIARVETNLISMAFTKEAYRNSGYMRRLMSGALKYQEQMNIPLCFVDTDEGKFFEHFGFHYIYDRPSYRLNTDVISAEMLERAAKGETILLNAQNTVLKVADSGSLLSLAHFVNANLCRRYGFFIIRSAAYYERFRKELQSTGGDLFLILENGQITGYFAYTKSENSNIREAVFANQSDQEQYLSKNGDRKPAVMARIINLTEMLRHISGNGKTTIAIRLSDPVIAKNDGDFIWYLDEAGSYMERVKQSQNGADASIRPEVSATIGEFTAFIFEYITLKRNAKFDNIYLAGPVWMDEKY